MCCPGHIVVLRWLWVFPPHNFYHQDAFAKKIDGFFPSEAVAGPQELFADIEVWENHYGCGEGAPAPLCDAWEDENCDAGEVQAFPFPKVITFYFTFW